MPNRRQVISTVASIATGSIVAGCVDSPSTTTDGSESSATPNDSENSAGFTAVQESRTLLSDTLEDLDTIQSVAEATLPFSYEGDLSRARDAISNDNSLSDSRREALLGVVNYHESLATCLDKASRISKGVLAARATESSPEQIIAIEGVLEIEEPAAFQKAFTAATDHRSALDTDNLSPVWFESESVASIFPLTAESIDHITSELQAARDFHSSAVKFDEAHRQFTDEHYDEAANLLRTAAEQLDGLPARYEELADTPETGPATNFDYVDRVAVIKRHQTAIDYYQDAVEAAKQGNHDEATSLQSKATEKFYTNNSGKEQGS